MTALKARGRPDISATAGGLALLHAAAIAAAAGSAGPAGGVWSSVSGGGPARRPVSSGSGSGVPEGGPEQMRVVALVDLARGGDTEAFAELYDRYLGQVYRYVYYRVGSHSVAEDLTSETFLRALRAISRFRWQGRDIGAWFVTIARNLVHDHQRSGRFRLEVSTADLLGFDAGDGGLEDTVMSRLESERMLAAVRRLTPQQQECVTLRFLQGLSVAETARAMGRREGAVRQMQFRAVRTLARLLGIETDPAAGNGSGADGPSDETPVEAAWPGTRG